MLEPRPPIVTILGHVDHGKTTLLDFIRKSSVAAREHGGITQHIGAYQVRVEQGGGSVETKNSEPQAPGNNLITFIDTPGHAAFEKMRSRGAKVADIAVLVVAVDDGIMPQTVEAIKHIKEAKVPMIVAVNKVDLFGSTLPSPNGERKIDFSNKELKIALDKIKKQLSDNQILVEEYGGDTPIVQLSAKSGEGVDKLLEIILLVAEIHELKGDSSIPAVGVVIEANLDKFKGPIATLLVRNGSLKKGDEVLLSGVKGKIRGMFDFAGKPVDTAGPSTPVEILGLEAVPAVGATLGEEAGFVEQKQVQSLIEKLRQQDTTVLGVIIKADKQGSLEAIEGALEQFNKDGEHVKVISAGTGDIGEADIKLASATRSIVIGFNTKMVNTASKIAETEHVLVRTYNIIYELIDELNDVVEGMLKVGALEEIFGQAQILAEFPYGKDVRIAGCKVVEGHISKGPKVRVVRAVGDEQEVVGEAKIKSIKHNKDEVSKVEQGQECGIMLDPQLDFQIGDIIQSYRTI